MLGGRVGHDLARAKKKKKIGLIVLTLRWPTHHLYRSDRRSGKTRYMNRVHLHRYILGPVIGATSAVEFTVTESFLYFIYSALLRLRDIAQHKLNELRESGNKREGTYHAIYVVVSFFFFFFFNDAYRVTALFPSKSEPDGQPVHVRF